MKHLKKIIFAAAILMLIGVISSIWVFAEETSPFTVDGQGYSTFNEAYAAADADSPIVLQSDFDTGYSSATISKSVTIDLNGHTMTGVEKNASGGYAYNLFTITSTGNLTITGHGTINVRRSLINVYKTGAVANIVGTGSGITIYQSAISAAPVLKVYETGTLNLSGKINFAVTASASSPCILLDGASNLNIENADISYMPTARFTSISANATTNITDSEIYIDKASNFAYSSTSTITSAPIFNLTNTDVTYGSGTSAALFYGPLCSVIDGGAIVLNSASFAQNTYTYSATDKIGIFIKEGTVFDKGITCSTTTPATKVSSGGFTLDEGCSWKPYFSKDHNLHFSLEPTTESTVSVYQHFNFSSATEGYSYNGAEATAGASSASLGGILAAASQRFGRINVRKTADGNKYVTYTATVARGSQPDGYNPYFYFYIGALNVAKDSDGVVTSVSTVNSMSDTDYYVYDLDITSETGNYPNIIFKMVGRYLSSESVNNSFLLDMNIKTSVIYGPYLEFAGNRFYLTNEALNWHHLTFILEIAEKRSESKIYVYVDGQLLGVLDNAIPTALDSSSSYYNSDMSNAAMTEVRIETYYTADETASFSIDNVTARTFAKGYAGDSASGLPAFLENPEKSLTECSDSIFTEDYEFPFTNHIASVNGVPYDDIDEAFSAALSTQDSTLSLMSDVTVDHTFSVSSGARITFDLNGYTLLTENMTDKPSSFSVGENATLKIKSSEPGGRIFNVSYKDGTPGGAAIVSCRYGKSTVNINGKNLSTYSASLIDASGTASSTTKITVDGGYYYATVKDSYGYIMNRTASASISVSNAVFSLPSDAHLYSTDSRYISGTSNATFSGCTVLAKTRDNEIINQLDTGSTVSFLDCNIYGSLIPATAKGGKITLDTNTRFAGIPAYDGTAFAIPSGYKFAGVDGESVNLTLYHNSFSEIDGRTSDDSLDTEKLEVSLNFQTSLVPESTETATVNWLDVNGSILYSEEFSVGAVASYAGELPVFDSGNEWYDYTIISWKGGTQITEVGATYDFTPELAPMVTAIGALQSITLYTGFNMHLYLPAPTHTISNITVTDADGNILEEGERQLINGMAYCVYTLSSSATDLAKNHVFNIEFTVTDEDKGIDATVLSTDVKLNVAKYAKALLEGNYSERAKSLAADMLRYAYECHKLANDTNISIFNELLEEYSKYLTDMPERFGYPRTYSSLSTYIKSAHFRLGSEADYVFTVSDSFTEGMTLKLVWQSVTGEAVTKTFEYNPDSKEYSTEGMKIYDVTAVMRITVEDTDGNQLALGYYSLATYINAMLSNPNIGFAKALYVFSSSAQKYRFPLARQESVSYSDFGAVGDGATDDFFSILSTHEFANLNGVKVTADAGKTYYIGNNGVCTVNITTDTDWTGAKFIIDDNGIALGDAAMGSNIFEISSSIPSITYTEKSEGAAGAAIAAINAAGGINKDTITHLDLGLGRKALLSVFNNTTAHYIRYGANENSGSAQNEVILVDENGKIDESTPFMFDYSKVTSIVVYSADDTPITITGGEITSNVKIIDVDKENQDLFLTKETTVSGVTKNYKLLKSYTAFYRGIKVSRSNTTVKGLEHYVGDEGDYGPAYSAFLSASATNNVLFEDCTVTGHRTFYCWGSDAAKSYVPMGTYDISANTANNVTWKNCVQTNFFHPNDPTLVSTDTVGANSIISKSEDGYYVSNGVKYWGIMGSNYVKNLTYDGSKLTRFDAHCGVYNATIINSEITIASIIGGGTFRIENSTMYSNKDAWYLLYLREDYGSSFNGDIIVKDVEWIAERNISEFAVLYSVYTNWNFGYTCYLPTNITVDNLTVTSPKGTGSALTLTLFSSSYMSKDYSADTYNGVENLNKTVLPKTYTVRNNYAGHVYKDPSGQAMFNSAPAGYFTYKYEEE